MDKRYEAAFEAVVSELRQDPEVVGILFTGSAQRGNPDATSDLDIYVVTHKPHYWRATRIVDGIEVELFFNNVASMRWRIEKEWKTAAGFATGEVILDRTGETAELVALAKGIWDAGPAAPTEDELLFLRYGLSDGLQDLEDVEMDPVASRVAGSVLVRSAMEVFCKINRYWGDKPKRLFAYVKQRDPLLGEMVADYYARGMHPKHAYEIVDYVLAPVGGRLVEWESKKVAYPAEGA